MKLKGKLLMAVIGLSAVCLITCPITSKAALQANGMTPISDTVGNLLLNIRNMEATGGTLGLQDTINTTNLLSTATESNDLDIHMEKNTEYGAMAILSASAYGNQNVIADGETTTGNKSGVVINLNKEWVSAGAGTKYGFALYSTANAKYKNVYTNSYVAKVGDTITETYGWHGSASTWIDKYYVYGGLVRGHTGSIFSYYGEVGGNYSYDASYRYTHPTRAVIVVGEGF